MATGCILRHIATVEQDVARFGKRRAEALQCLGMLVDVAVLQRQSAY